MKHKKSSREFGFLMVGYEKPEMIQELQNTIPYEELYVEDGNDDFGIEDETHVTLAPCLDNDIDVDELKKLLMPLDKYGIILSNISKFENDKYDVLKCDVGSFNLHKTNAEVLEKFESHSEFKEYHPHLTIAYMKKGMADKYLEDSIMPMNVLKPQKFIWSYVDGDGNDAKLEWI